MKLFSFFHLANFAQAFNTQGSVDLLASTRSSVGMWEKKYSNACNELTWRRWWSSVSAKALMMVFQEKQVGSRIWLKHLRAYLMLWWEERERFWLANQINLIHNNSLICSSQSNKLEFFSLSHAWLFFGP